MNDLVPIVEDLDVVVLHDIMGKTLRKIEVNEYDIKFHTTDAETFIMYHDQDCCESVGLVDIIGDIEDLVGSPIVLAENRTSEITVPEGFENYLQMWTFYEFATNQGSVTLRWFGSSNGYYGIGVSFHKV